MARHAKTAVVTGAGTGIGKAVALTLLKNGYNIVLAGRRREMLVQTAAEAKSARGRTLILPADVGDPKAVRTLFSKARKAFGRLDLLFNNAGINARGVPFEDLSYPQWRSVLNTNLTGVFLCAQAAFRLMKDQTPRGGRIINNGSLSAHMPRPNSAPYTASKHGVTGLTKCLSLEGRKYNIACGQIDIGNAADPAAKHMARQAIQADGSYAWEPRMDVAHIAHAVLYMASLPLDANVQFITLMATKMPFIGRG